MGESQHPEVERRGRDIELARAHRLKTAGMSTPIGMAIAIIVVEGAQAAFGVHLSSVMLYALAAVAGSLTTTVSMCFDDIRAMLLTRFMHRRAGDRKRP